MQPIPVTPTATATVPIMPDQLFIEKNESWYKDCVLFWAGQYNPVLDSGVQIAKSNNAGEAGKNNPTSGRFVDKCLRNFSYFFGEQNNITYGHFIRDENNRPLPTRLINGQTIYELIKHRSGFMYDAYVQDLHRRVSVRDNSPDFISDLDNRIKLASMQAEMRSAGVQVDGFEPLDGVEFDNEEQISLYLKERPMEKIERIFSSVARDFLWTVNYEEQFKQLIDYLNICGFGRVFLRVENGEMKMDVYRPDQCIYDTTSTSEFGRDDSGGGVVDYLTIPELFTRFPDFDDTQKAEIQQIAKANSVSSAVNLGYTWVSGFIGTSGYPYWRWNNGVPMVGVVTAYWKGYDNGMEKVYGASFIGNKYLKKAGEAPNQIEKQVNKSYVELPFRDYRPDMFFGKNKTLVDRLFFISDRIDGLEAKIDLFINRAKGTILIMNGGELPEGTTPKEILTNIATLNFVYLDMDMDEAVNQYGKGRVFDVADLNLNGQAVEAVNREIQRLEVKCKQIAFTPDAALGQQTPQGSFKEQQGIINQASYGTVTYDRGFVKYLNNIIQLGTEMSRLILCTEEKEKVMRFSDKEVMFIKFMKEWTLKDLNVHIDQDDALTPQDRAEWSQIEFSFSQNPQNYKGLTLADFATIKLMNSKREIAAYLKAQQARADAKEQQKLAQEQAIADQQNQRNNATQLTMNQQQIDGGLQKEAMKTERDLMTKGS